MEPRIKKILVLSLTTILLFPAFTFAEPGDPTEETVPQPTTESPTQSTTEPPTEETSTPATKETSTLTGIPKIIKKKSRSQLKQTVVVTPALGRTLELQMYQPAKKRWTKKKTYTLPDTQSASLSITFPKDWWRLASSQWRLLLPETETATQWTSETIKVKTLRYFQNPKKYVQIKNQITLTGGGYALKPGYMGLKVRRVNGYFGIGSRYWPRYTWQTKSKVKGFQRRKGLKSNGIVNKATWLKMGFSEKSWYRLGAYASPVQVTPASTKKEHIEAMVSRAKKYLGSDYVVGGSGTPGQGADCSGLMMQALYAAGVDMSPINPVRHAKPGYEYESRNLWASQKLKTVSFSKKKRGDLIFYRGASGLVNHVALYLGKGKCIESWPNRVVIWPVKNGHRSRIMGVKRVII